MHEFCQNKITVHIQCYVLSLFTCYYMRRFPMLLTSSETPFTTALQYRHNGSYTLIEYEFPDHSPVGECFGYFQYFSTITNKVMTNILYKLFSTLIIIFIGVSCRILGSTGIDSVKVYLVIYLGIYC